MEGIENDELIGDEVGWGWHKVRLNTLGATEEDWAQ